MTDDKLTMPPMFLPGVENNPQPGPYYEDIRRMQASGYEYSQIWHLFSYLPQATGHLARFTQEILRGPAPLSTGMRELIAAYTSYQNECQFCLKSHAAIATELLGDEDLVWGVLRDLENSRLDEKHKALFRFAGKVTHDAQRITAEDMKPLYAVGWDDDAIYFTITVCALFNFYNRWVGASGVHVLSDEAHRQRGKWTAQQGYVRS